MIDRKRIAVLPVVAFLAIAPVAVGFAGANPAFAAGSAALRAVSPTKAPSGKFAQVSVGGYYFDGTWNTFACALKKTTGKGSKPACWGNPKGESGLSVAAPKAYLTQISAGGHVICGLKSSGAIACSGGYGYHPLPVTKVPSGKFSQVSSGFVYSCGIRRVTDKVACWGQIGSVKHNIPTDSFTQISVGFSEACGLLTDGSINCFGTDPFPTPPAGAFTDVAVGYGSACAVSASGALTCWGTGTASNAPAGTYRQVSIEGSSDNPFVVDEFACAVEGVGPAGGKVKCWGTPPSVNGRKTGEAHPPRVRSRR